MKISRLITLFAPLSAFLQAASLNAAVNITVTPTPDSFPAIPAPADWSTLFVGTASVLTTPAAFDTKVIAAADAATIITTLGSSATIPPSTNGTIGARWNDGTMTVPVGITFLQTRPTGIDYLLLLAHLVNATGGPLSSVTVAYDYFTDTNTATEDVEGLRAYWSITGAPDSWTLIPALSVDTAGTYTAPQKLTATITLSTPLANGGTMFLLWADQNSTVNPDASYHIDNFAASGGTGTPPICTLSGTSSNILRSAGVNPSDPADDTVTFTVTVTGTGTLSPSGWTVSAPASQAGTGAAYGSPLTFPNIPISNFTSGSLVLTVRDATTAACITNVSVDVGRVIGTDSTNGSKPILTAGTVPTQWVIDETAQTATMNNGAGERVLTTAPVNLTTSTGFVRMSLDFESSETSAGSNFETDDTMLVELHLNDGVNPEQVIVLTQPFDADASGRMNGYTGVAAATPPPTALDDYNTNKAKDEYNKQGQDGADSTDNTFSMSYDIPDSITSAFVVVKGDNDSASETFIIKNLRFETSGPSLRVTAGPTIANNHGTADPSDDTYTAPITINGILLGASTGWTSNGTPASGLYSAPNPVIFGPFSGPRTLTFTDNLNNTITASVALIPPATAPLYIIGQKNFGAGAQDIQNLAGSTAPAEWVNDATARTLTMTVGIATDSIVTSELIDLSGVGVVTFSANVNVAETSVGTNLEMTDRFKAELIIDGVPRNLVTAYDKGNGASAIAGTGLNGAPDGYINGYTGAAGTDVVNGTVYALAADDYNANAARDEFNLGIGIPPVPQPVADTIAHDFPLSFSIPASANSVQLKIYGTGFAGSETVVVSSVLFTASTGGVVDSDGDGVSDTDEGIMGTDPNNRSSVLRLSQSAADSKVITFPTVNGRFYRVFSSPDLQTWTAGGTTIAGNGSTQSFTVTVVPGQPRRSYRLHVKGTDGPW